MGLESAGLSDRSVPFLLPVVRKYIMFKVGNMSYMECVCVFSECVCLCYYLRCTVVGEFVYLSLSAVGNCSVLHFVKRLSY